MPELGDLGAVVRSNVEDAQGWRWRCLWEGIEIGAWNDMDGVAIIADVGPSHAWLGLAGHPPDPTPVEALIWAIEVLSAWRALDPSGLNPLGLNPLGEAEPE